MIPRMRRRSLSKRTRLANLEAAVFALIGGQVFTPAEEPIAAIDPAPTCPMDGQSWEWHQHFEPHAGWKGEGRTNAEFMGCAWSGPKEPA